MFPAVGDHLKVSPSENYQISTLFKGIFEGCLSIHCPK